MLLAPLIVWFLSHLIALSNTLLHFCVPQRNEEHLVLSSVRNRKHQTKRLPPRPWINCLFFKVYIIINGFSTSGTNKFSDGWMEARTIHYLILFFIFILLFIQTNIKIISDKNREWQKKVTVGVWIVRGSLWLTCLTASP